MVLSPQLLHRMQGNTSALGSSSRESGDFARHRCWATDGINSRAGDMLDQVSRNRTAACRARAATGFRDQYAHKHITSHAILVHCLSAVARLMERRHFRSSVMPKSTASFTAIPRLDLSLSADPITQRELLSQLRYALTEIGFLYVENHGVSQALISDVIAALPVLFALSDEAKAEVALANSPHFLGYSGDGSETTAGTADRREQFEFATELPATWTHEQPLSERLRGPNPVRG